MPPHSTTPESTDGRTDRWAGQQERRRAELIEAALAAIAEHGPTVSTEQIAAHAGVSRPHLYRRFRGAEDLHRQVARRIGELVLAEMTPLLNNPGGSPRAIIGQSVSAMVRWLTDNAHLYRYLVHRAAEGKDTDEDVVGGVRTAIGSQLSTLLAAYMEILEVRQPIADPGAFGIVGFVESATNRWLDEPGELTRDELIEHLTGWIWGTIDHVLRSSGVHIEADTPLPDL